MNRRLVLSILTNLLSAFLPFLVLIRVFGFEATMQLGGPRSVQQLVWLSATMLFAFIGGLASGLFLKKGPPTLRDIPNVLLHYVRERERHTVHKPA